MSRPIKDHYDSFDALANPIRRQILESLAAGDRAAGELGAGLEITPAALSQHLQVLRRAGLVSDQRDGQRRVYTLNREPFREVDGWIKAMMAGRSRNPRNPRNRRNSPKRR